MPNLITMVAETSPSIDTALVSEVMAVVKSVMSLFGEYPLNVLLIISIACAAIAIFRRARHAAT